MPVVVGDVNRMIVSELPTLESSYSSHTLDSDDDGDSDDDEDIPEPILDVRAARQRVAARREPAAEKGMGVRPAGEPSVSIIICLLDY